MGTGRWSRGVWHGVSRGNFINLKTKRVGSRLLHAVEVYRWPCFQKISRPFRLCLRVWAMRHRLPQQSERLLNTVTYRHGLKPHLCRTCLLAGKGSAKHRRPPSPPFANAGGAVLPYFLERTMMTGRRRGRLLLCTHGWRFLTQRLRQHWVGHKIRNQRCWQICA